VSPAKNKRKETQKLSKLVRHDPVWLKLPKKEKDKISEDYKATNPSTAGLKHILQNKPNGAWNESRPEEPTLPQIGARTREE